MNDVPLNTMLMFFPVEKVPVESFLWYWINSDKEIKNTDELKQGVNLMGEGIKSIFHNGYLLCESHISNNYACANNLQNIIHYALDGFNILPTIKPEWLEKPEIALKSDYNYDKILGRIIAGGYHRGADYDFF